MSQSSRLLRAACFGLLAVMLGAFGAHFLRPLLETRGTVDVWATAVLYHLIHTLVLLFLVREEQLPAWIGGAFTLGILLFSGSLYLLATLGWRWLGPLTPLGGVALMAGWLGVAWQGWRGMRENR